MRKLEIFIGAFLLAYGLVASAASGEFLPGVLPKGDDFTFKIAKGQEEAVRNKALSQALVWKEPTSGEGPYNFLETPEGQFSSSVEVKCKYHQDPEGLNGSSPKFKCILPPAEGETKGEVIKVKYGKGNTEIPDEVASSRFLRSQGFGADKMYFVKRLLCYGCGSNPGDRFKSGSERPDFSRAQLFENVAIEIKESGKKIDGKKKGWDWAELSKITDGASRAELDALRLANVFLANVDTKSENQRLMCLPGGWSKNKDAAGVTIDNGECAQGFAWAIAHDEGDTFGPKQQSLDKWAVGNIWASNNASDCTAVVPGQNRGGTFKGPLQITEEGRALLAKWMNIRFFNDQQIRDLFVGAGFDKDVEGWVSAFKKRMDQIVNKGPCNNK